MRTWLLSWNRAIQIQNTVMPFGLCPACWVFTKLTNELVGHWRSQGIKLVHYLDDFLFAVPGDANGGTRFSRARSSEC